LILKKTFLVFISGKNNTKTVHVILISRGMVSALLVYCSEKMYTATAIS